jgi:hypothetical protein
MAEIPARENFKNTKTAKTSQIPLGPKEKLLGRAGLVLYIFFPKLENGFECDFSRIGVSDFPSGDRKAKTSQTLTRPSKWWLQNYFRTSGRKSVRLSRPFPTTLASRGPVAATRLKVSARHLQWGGARAREHLPKRSGQADRQLELAVGHAHGRERKSGMGVTFLLSHCRKGVEWCVNRREIVGLVGIAERD